MIFKVCTANTILKPKDTNYHTINCNDNVSGFTLVELSIVLIIVGLVVGGVIMGQDLINTNALRSQVSQIEKYSTAVNVFKEKYNCLPGDCANASDFFGTSWVTWGSPDFYGNANGDGNGLINDNKGDAAPYEMHGEPAILFRHLFLAGLTECCYNTSTAWWNTDTIIADKVYPATKIGDGGFIGLNIDGTNGWWLGMRTKTLSAPIGGGYIGDYLNNQAGGLLTPHQAKAIDIKIDDGKPFTGKVYDAWVSGGDHHIHPGTYHIGYVCIYPSVDTNSYNIGSTTPSCDLFIPMR